MFAELRVQAWPSSTSVVPALSRDPYSAAAVVRKGRQRPACKEIAASGYGSRLKAGTTNRRSLLLLLPFQKLQPLFHHLLLHLGGVGIVVVIVFLGFGRRRRRI